MNPSAQIAVSLPLSITREDVLHFLGYPHGREPPPRTSRIIDDVLPEARQLARGAGAFERVEAARAGELGLEPMDASGLVIGLVTIGGALESRVSRYIAEGASTRSLVLDAAGSAAAEETADRLGAIIGGDEVRDGAPRHVSCRVSPGYGRWSIGSQQKLFAVLPYETVGVTLLPTMLMSPRKSISFAMWLGADARPIAGLSGCATCGLEKCRYRRA